MNLLFYRYGNICEDDYIAAFQAMNLIVNEEKSEMHNKSLLPSEQVGIIQKAIDTYHPLFVFSINFFPAIAEVCHIYQIKYVCQTVDSPVLELLSPAICYDTNRIFLFDKAQYDYFSPKNPDCIFYLPLGCNAARYDSVLSTVSDPDRQQFSSDISFVGSLYEEKNPLSKLKLSDYDRGFIEGIISANENLCGINLMESLLPDSIVKHIKEADKSFFSLPDANAETDRYVAAHAYIGMQAAVTDRIHTLNRLAKHFETTLYTRSNPTMLQNVIIRGGVSTHTQMPKIFALSKINLNMTIPPIQTGLPLRIFDIMGCGGFVMTNYQEEIPSLFSIGEELEVYTCQDELIEKCAYYLEHEEKRQQIARNGYLCVKQKHLYLHRVMEMVKIIAKE